MIRRLLQTSVATALMVAVTACAPTPTSTPSTAHTPSSTPSDTPAPATPTAAPVEAAPDEVVGTTVQFTSDRTSVLVTIDQDTPAVWDFLSLLPLELMVEEFASTEKIAYLPRELNYVGSPGSDPEDGDLIYYAPWGNLAFYYDATGAGYSDATLHIGTYTATEEQLSLLEGGPVTITLAD